MSDSVGPKLGDPLGVKDTVGGPVGLFVGLEEGISMGKVIAVGPSLPSVLCAESVGAYVGSGVGLVVDGLALGVSRLMLGLYESLGVSLRVALGLEDTLEEPLGSILG